MPSAHTLYAFTHDPVLQETGAGYYQLLAQPEYNAFRHREACHTITRLLQRLPARRQRLCRLHFVEDYNYDEIACITGLRPTTVKNHIAWSMIILRNYMVKPKAPV